MHRFSRSTLVGSALFIGAILVPKSGAQQPAAQTLTLEQAITAARESNPGLRAIRQQVEEAGRRSRVMFSNYLPRVKTQAAYMGSNNTRGILLPAGSLGNIPGMGAFPPTSMSIPQGGQNGAFAVTSAQQPITQFFKIREGHGVTQGEEAAKRATLRRTEQEVSVGVLKAYAGLLIAEKQREVATARVDAATKRTAMRTVAVQSGMAVDVVASEARLRVLQARQELLEAEDSYADLSYALADATGLAGNTPLTVVAPGPDTASLDSLDVYVAAATASNPEVLEAQALVEQATHGVGAAKTSYIPDVGVFGAHFYQSSLPFFPHNTLFFGAIGSITLLDFGARSNTLGERKAQLSAANQNLARIKGKVRGDVEAAYRRVARAREVVSLAREAFALRSEALRLRVVQAGAGYGVPAEESEANADRLDAELNVLKAEMGYRIARAELDQAAGRLAR